MKRTYDADPAWNRGGSHGSVAKKKRMCSRASLRMLRSLIKKRRAERKRETKCVTRTVELPSTQTIGKLKSKLLFMVAIGLTPNTAKPPLTDAGEPLIRVERLDPAVEAEAKARTKEVVYEIFKKREAESLQRRARHRHHSSTPPTSLHDPYDDNVEIVDLVSDEDRSSSSLSDDEVEGQVRHHSILPHSIRGQRVTTDTGTSGYRIITPQPRKPVFKQLANNQESGIFRNWKPESMTKLMNLKKSEECNSPLNGSQSKLLSSLKSIPVSTLTVRNYASGLAADGSCKSQAHGAQDDASSVSRISKLEYHVPANLIID